MATTIRIPDVGPITVPRDGVTVEEARRIATQMGYAQVETAVGTREGDTITFQRAVGGEKGFESR